MKYEVYVSIPSSKIHKSTDTFGDCTIVSMIKYIYRMKHVISNIRYYKRTDTWYSFYGRIYKVFI